MRLLNPLRDKQQDPPLCYCYQCGGEIYEPEKEICDTCREIAEQDERSLDERYQL